MALCQRRFVFLLVVLGCLLAFVSGQGANECTATGGTTAENAVNIVTGPSKIIYIIIGNTGFSYQTDMRRCGTWLEDAVPKWAPNTGSSVDIFQLKGDVAVQLPDLTPYNQVWIVDLSSQGYTTSMDVSAGDSAPWQMDAYARIAAWWENRGRPHVILDARIISSCWIRLANNDKTKDRLLIENYFVNLRVRGGGLFIGTDHNAFHQGVNHIPPLLKINPFWGNFYLAPYKMRVDIENTLMKYPNQAYHSDGDGVNVPTNWIWDDSSTGNVAYNLQPNGLVFYSLAWHWVPGDGSFNSGVGQPGLSTTIRGSVGFLVTISSPACHDRYEAGVASISFTSTIPAANPGTPPYTYTWSSNVDGKLATTASFSTSSLNIGTHIVTLHAVDSQNLVAEAKVSITVFRPFGTNETEGPVAAWNGNKDVQVIYPIRRAATPKNYYNYLNSRANTADFLETTLARSGNIFFYDDGSDLYIFHIFGNPNTDSTISSAGFTATFPALRGRAGSLIFADPPGSTNYVWNSAAGTGSAKFSWKSSTAGFIAGPLPKNFEFCIDYTFDKGYENNVAYYMVRGHTEGSFSLPNPNPILAFRSSAVQTASLSLCWRQFKCPTTPAVINTPMDFVTNSIVQFAYEGSLFNYTDLSNCYWVATPKTGSSKPILAMWVEYTRWAQRVGDAFVIRNGTDAADPIVSNLDGTTTTLPARMRFDGAQSLRFESIPTNDDSVDSGFGINYYVVPTAITVTPSSGPYLQATTVTIAGGNFYRKFVNGVPMNSLYCKIDDVIVVPATFTDFDTITCIIPARPAGAKSNVPLVVSNDGVEYSNEILWAWVDPTCSTLTNCGSCLAESGRNCRWCNGNSLCYAEGDVFSCDGVVDSTCCTQCQTLGGCNLQGTCNCNNTCTCSNGFRDDDCGCKSCPVNPTTGTVCGIPATPESVGTGLECGCDGVCECMYGYNGDSCQCPYCPFSGDTECGGHGSCECGTCNCTAGWTGDACECPTTCPSSNDEVCSGHGSCQCGQCVCDANWRLLDDCSCRESCGTKGCSGNGECNCDGTCTCYIGFEGDDCEIEITCNSTTCDDCMKEKDGICGWCSDSSRCESKYQRLVCDKARPQGLGATLPYATECPAEIIITTLPETDPVGIAIGGAVSGVVALGAIAAAAAVLYRRRNAPIVEDNPWIDDPANNDSVVSNPLYEATQFQGSNPLYDAPPQQDE